MKKAAKQLKIGDNVIRWSLVESYKLQILKPRIVQDNSLSPYLLTDFSLILSLQMYSGKTININLKSFSYPKEKIDFFEEEFRKNRKPSNNRFGDLMIISDQLDFVLNEIKKDISFKTDIMLILENCKRNVFEILLSLENSVKLNIEELKNEKNIEDIELDI